MEWTSEQEEIFNWFRKGRGNLLVDAKAGSGKSTTIKEGVIWAPESSVLICAFNKHIADEMQAGFKNKINNRVIKVATSHSTGYEIIRHYWPKTTLSFGRSEEIARLVFDRAKIKKRFSLIKAVVDTCAKVKDALPLAETIDDILMVGEDFDTLAPAKHLNHEMQATLVLSTLEASKQNTGSIGFDDMAWLPIVNNWQPPGRYRLVIVDEGQDLSSTQMLLAKLMVAAPFGRMAFFADKFQGCYSWRGADKFSVERIRQEVKCSELPLNVTFRCSKAVTKEAQSIVPAIRPLESAIQGKVRAINFAEIALWAQPGDFILSRYNAPLVPACIAIKRMGLKVFIDGKEALSQAKNIIGKIERSGNGIGTFEADVQTWMQKEIAIARSRGSPARSQRAMDFGLLLSRLAKEANSMKEINEILDSLFKGRRSQSAIVCSTIHRSKGREAPRVFILRDTLPLRNVNNEEYSKHEIDHQEEANLEYIAITRAKSDLFWVTGIPVNSGGARDFIDDNNDLTEDDVPEPEFEFKSPFASSGAKIKMPWDP